jgi:hypothetical protein
MFSSYLEPFAAKSILAEIWKYAPVETITTDRSTLMRDMFQ